MVDQRYIRTSSTSTIGDAPLDPPFVKIQQDAGSTQRLPSEYGRHGEGSSGLGRPPARDGLLGGEKPVWPGLEDSRRVPPGGVGPAGGGSPQGRLGRHRPTHLSSSDDGSRGEGPRGSTGDGGPSGGDNPLGGEPPEEGGPPGRRGPTRPSDDGRRGEGPRGSSRGSPSGPPPPPPPPPRRRRRFFCF